MFTSLPGPEPLILTVFILFSLSFLVQLLFYWIVFSRLAWYKNKTERHDKCGVSVVICARNEYFQLRENLPLILSQDYPDFEVVVVNNSSDDDSNFLLTQMAEDYNNLKIVEIRENLNFFSGKKFPLSIGIKSASKEMILVTDADCRPAGPHWISSMVKNSGQKKSIVLGYGGYIRKPGLLNGIIRFDTAHIAMQYLSYAAAGIPYMGVGRNMAYLKSLFYANNGFISHYRIPSGDDDLFINRVARKSNTGICIDPESFTWSEPKSTFAGWVRQKKRHLTTGRYYRPVHKLLLGSYSGSLFLFYLTFFILISLVFQFYLILAIFAIRLICQLVLFRNCLGRLQEKNLWLFIVFYEPLLLVVNIYISISNLFVKPTGWK